MMQVCITSYQDGIWVDKDMAVPKKKSELAAWKISFSPSWLILDLMLTLNCCKIKFILELCYEFVKNKFIRTALKCLSDIKKFITDNHSLNTLWCLVLQQQRDTKYF